MGSKNILVDPSGEFTSTADIGNVIVGTSNAGSAVYLRDLVDIRSEYQSPARYLNFYTWRDENGKWQPYAGRDAFCADAQGRPDRAVCGARARENLRDQETVAADLVIAATSDQPRQVKENVDLSSWTRCTKRSRWW